MHFRDEKEESCVFCFGNRKTEEKMKKKLSKLYPSAKLCTFSFFHFKLMHKSVEAWDGAFLCCVSVCIHGLLKEIIYNAC